MPAVNMHMLVGYIGGILCAVVVIGVISLYNIRRRLYRGVLEVGKRATAVIDDKRIKGKIQSIVSTKDGDIIILRNKGTTVRVPAEFVVTNE